MAAGSRDVGSGCQLAEAADERLDGLSAERLDGREERPLVVERVKVCRVEKQGRAPFAAGALQGKGDQVPERPLGHEVLGGEEAVVAGQVELGPHRLAEEVNADPPG